MFFYWRIVEELKELNEIVIFRDPSLQRMFKRWVTRHYEAISDEEGQGVYSHAGAIPSLARDLFELAENALAGAARPRAQRVREPLLKTRRRDEFLIFAFQQAGEMNAGVVPVLRPNDLNPHRQTVVG